MTDRLTPEREAEIATRAEAATKGPWGIYESGSMIDVAADLQETGCGYRARRGIACFEDEPLDNDPTHKEWTAEEDWAQVQADAVFVAHAREDVDVLRAELAAVRAERDQAQETLAFLERNTVPDLHRTIHHHQDGKKRWRDRAEKAEARVAELERPAVELKRNEIRLSYRQLAVQAREERDYEGEATVLKQLADHEEQWKREDVAGGGV